jgi:hypothetical protein
MGILQIASQIELALKTYSHVEMRGGEDKAENNSFSSFITVLRLVWKADLPLCRGCTRRGH